MTGIDSALGQRGGAEGGRRDLSILVKYLTTEFHGMFLREKFCVRATKAVRALAEALDLLSSEDLPRPADLLVRRSKGIADAVK